MGWVCYEVTEHPKRPASLSQGLCRRLDATRQIAHLSVEWSLIILIRSVIITVQRCQCGGRLNHII